MRKDYKSLYREYRRHFEEQRKIYLQLKEVFGVKKRPENIQDFYLEAAAWWRWKHNWEPLREAENLARDQSYRIDYLENKVLALENEPAELRRQIANLKRIVTKLKKL
jgi:phage shock protein A